ncbi:MAG: hypothetical protein WKG07_10230 [Hymenobacter sp.]
MVARFVPWLLPFYLVFAYLSWFKDPLFDSLLRLNRYGRYALSPAQTLHSTHFLALLGLGLAAGLGGLLGAPVPGLGTLALVALGLLFPLVGTERLAGHGQPKQHGYSRWAGWALAAVGALAVALAMLAIPNQLTVIFLYATVAYTWAACAAVGCSFLIVRRGQRATYRYRASWPCQPLPLATAQRRMRRPASS